MKARFKRLLFLRTETEFSLILLSTNYLILGSSFLILGLYDFVIFLLIK